MGCLNVHLADLVPLNLMEYDLYVVQVDVPYLVGDLIDQVVLEAVPVPFLDCYVVSLDPKDHITVGDPDD